MKKNTMMRVASVLLVAVLLSTCAISGTFAKYVTSEQGADSARVAKWGVELVVDSFVLFADDYETDDNTFNGTYSVSSAGADGDAVLAPGTKGTFADIEITGTPEVAVDVKVEATVNLSDNWKDEAGKFYCPVVVTVGNTAICGLTYNDVTDFENAIATAIGNYSKQYDPNQDLSRIDANFDISWEWAFDGTAHAELGCECNAGAQTDDQDTALGDAAANAAQASENLTIEIGVQITITQIN